MRKIALLFPGQGSQTSGMGLDLYNNFEIAKETFNKIDKILNRKISEICFKGSEEDLKITKNTQPAILAVSVVALEVFKSLYNIEPKFLAGHSLGEYGAMYASGALNIENCFRLIQARADYMQETAQKTNGKMAAILGLDANIIRNAIKTLNNVYVANYNEPKQTVISGLEEDVLKACDILKEQGARRAIPLAVSGAFHSPFMNEASEKFEKFVENIEINNSKIPIITNIDGEITTKAEDFKLKMPKQINSSVQWTKTIENMLKNGVDTFVEIGQGKVLSGLVKKMANENITILNISDKISLENTIKELENDR